MADYISFQHLQTIISSGLGIDVQEISEQDKYGHTSWWTSLRHVELMVLLEDAFGIELSAENAENLTSIIVIMETINHAKS